MKVLAVLSKCVTVYLCIGAALAAFMCIAAKEFNLAAFLVMTVIWPFVVMFRLAFHLGE